MQSPNSAPPADPLGESLLDPEHRARPAEEAKIGTVSPQDMARLAMIGGTFARHGVNIAMRQGAFVAGRPQQRVPRAVAVAIRRSFVDLGPTFLKLGQFIASSPGLFPEVVSDECQKLLQDVPPEPSEKVRDVIERSLGSPIEVLFAEFWDEPEAAASIAQVHKARLHDGRLVAVKIRRPRLGLRIEQDLRLLKVMAFGLQQAGAIGQAANPPAIVRDFATTLRSEIDFRREAANMAEFGRNLRASGKHDRVVVPEPIEEMVAERVVVMTFVEGKSVAELALEPGPHDDFEELLRIGVRAWFESVFVHGFFHGDVHAGNLFVTPDRKVAFLDFGIMGRLDERVRNVMLSTIWSMLSTGDFHAVVAALNELDATTEPIDTQAAVADLEELATPILDQPLAEISYGDLFSHLITVATKYKIRLPAELVLVAKQLVYFERYAKEIAPEYKILADTELWQL